MIVVKFKKPWEVFFLSICSIFLVGSLIIYTSMIRDALKSEEHFIPGLVAGTLIFIPIAVFSGLAVLESIYGRVIADDQKIYASSFFYRNRCIYLKDLKGYQSHAEGIIFVSKTPGVKGVIVSRYCYRGSDFYEWMRKHKIKFLEPKPPKEQPAYRDKSLSKDAYERKLKQARMAAAILNCAGGITAVWVCFLPYFHQVAVVMATLVTLCSIAMLKYFKGWLYLFDQRFEPSYKIDFGLIGPALGLMLQALLSYDLADYHLVIWHIAIVALILTLIICVNNPEIRPHSFDYLPMGFLMLLVTGALGFGSLLSINGSFDHAAPRIFTTTITGKNISGGNSTTYNFDVAPWSTRKKGMYVWVSKKVFDQKEVGDTLYLFEFKGALGYPWVELGEYKANSRLVH